MSNITLIIDGQTVSVAEGISVAAALDYTGLDCCRDSVTQQPRAAFCGMGICQECRITVSGQRRLACQTLCQQGMRIERSCHEPVNL